MQLLCKFKAGAVRFHHLKNAAQVAFRPLETLGDGIVMVVGIRFHHGRIISPRRIWT